LASASQALVNAQPTEFESLQLGAGFGIQTLVPASPCEVSITRPKPARPQASLDARRYGLARWL